LRACTAGVIINVTFSLSGHAMTVERTVIEHYRHGTLEEDMLKALAAAGKDIDRLTPDDLAPVDEFHIGGRRATVDFASELAPAADMHLLDIGSGLGGPARYFAQAYRCRVTGLDLSEEYVAVAGALAQRVGLADQVSYRQGNALDLPFDDATFDGAYMMHVGMNIADKARLYSEVHRVLKPGGAFGLYDVMRINEGLFSYPVPWSSGEETNFIETPATYRALLSAEGFEVVKERDRRQLAVDFYRERMANAAKRAGRPLLSVPIYMGANAAKKVANMNELLERGTIAPVEMICRRVEANPHAGNV
jgi:ubiquinone/menaquinone biosynthesis C-methylase UbiE